MSLIAITNGIIPKEVMINIVSKLPFKRSSLSYLEKDMSLDELFALELRPMVVVEILSVYDFIDLSGLSKHFGGDGVCVSKRDNYIIRTFLAQTILFDEIEDAKKILRTFTKDNYIYPYSLNF